VKSNLRTILIMTVSMILFVLVIRQVGFTDLVDTIRGAEPVWILISLLLAPILILVSVIKWRILLRSQGVKMPVFRLYGLYLVGRYFNYFLPSNVGGDVVRGYELGKYTQNGAQAMASVFMERFTGFVMLVVFAVVSSLTNLELINKAGLTPIIFLSVVVLLVVLWLILDSRPLAMVDSHIKIPLAQNIIHKLQKFHNSLNAYRKKKKTLAIAFFWSFLFMVLAITNVYSSARAFYQPISWVDISIIVPVILVIAMFPITINGLGIQEWAYVFLFSMIGLPASVGLSTILLIRGKDILLAIIGGLIFPVMKIRNQSNLSQNEMMTAKISDKEENLVQDI
jgi:hypothetical protein